MFKKKSPVIGVTLDWRASGHYSLYPWYAMRQNYCDRIADEGGLPILLPYHLDKVEEYLDQMDGLLITGGDFDVHPSLYGEEASHERVSTIEGRTFFEYELTQQALKRNMPVFGICGGHQLLNVVLGGSLIQHIPEEIKTKIEHEQPNPRTEPGHDALIHDGTMLHQIVGKGEIPVNSAHHQAVKKPGEGVVVNAVSPDGIIEGFEVPSYKFCLGIQWHPEYLISHADKQIFEAFVSAARLYNE